MSKVKNQEGFINFDEILHETDAFMVSHGDLGMENFCEEDLPNTMMVILTVYTFLWGRLYLALSGVERGAMNHNGNNEALGTILN